MDRQRRRALDISESYYLLLELCCTEPLIQQCFSVIENVCLAHGVNMSGKRPTPNFQHHMDLHYVPFLKGAIRAMHMYGFVPWRLMKLESGDMVPEVLPAGSFRWTIEPPAKSDRDVGSNQRFTSNYPDAMLVYVVRLNPGARQEENITVTQWLPPNYNVCENSVMYATVPSPMAYIIQSYKNIQAATQRQAHADAWNCTARIIVANEPKEFAHDQHRRELFGTFNQHIDEYGRLQATKPLNPSDKIDDMFYARSNNHIPSVYSLPAHHHIDNAPVLQPCADLSMLQAKYKVDVCSLLGIPPELITGGMHHKEHGTAQDKTNNKNVSTGRIFQAKMQTVCFFLKTLLSEVYKTTYKGAEASFELIPMPRLEVSSIEDLQVLHEIGVLQPEHTIDLASILLGKLKKAKKNPLDPFGQTGQPGQQEQQGSIPTKPAKGSEENKNSKPDKSKPQK